MIRKAVETDIPYIIETGMRLHARSGNEDVPVHKPHVFQVLRVFVHGRDKLCVVSERDEIIRGFLMATVEPFWWADPVRGRRFVTDWAFYSEHRGDGVKMLQAMQDWAWAQPRVVEVACATNVPKGRGVIDGLFKRAGFSKVGGRYKVNRPNGEAEIR
jgi:hypothetical protein